MNEVVAKKYVKAILSDAKPGELNAFIENLVELAVAFGSDKFKSIISLPTLKAAKKVEFTLSLVNNSDAKFANFIKLLGANKRLELIPAILNEMKIEQSLLENTYRGEVIGNFDLSAEQLKALEENFSKKFDSKIKLDGSKSDYNGVKVELDDLGVEVNFSIDRLKSQMSEYILKAI